VPSQSSLQSPLQVSSQVPLQVPVQDDSQVVGGFSEVFLDCKIGEGLAKRLLTPPRLKIAKVGSAILTIFLKKTLLL